MRGDLLVDFKREREGSDASFSGDSGRSAIADAVQEIAIQTSNYAAEFGAAAVAACAYNVRINHAFMKDADAVTRQENELARYERESRALLSAMRRSLL